MLKAIIIIVILTWAYLGYLLIRLHRLINREHKELEKTPEPESTEEAIQKEFVPRPEECQKMYDKQLGYERKAHAYLNPDLHMVTPSQFTDLHEKIQMTFNESAKAFNKELEAQIRKNAIPPIEGEITKEELETRNIVIFTEEQTGRSYIAQDGHRISDYFWSDATGIHMKSTDTLIIPRPRMNPPKFKL